MPKRSSSILPDTGANLTSRGALAFPNQEEAELPVAGMSVADIAEKMRHIDFAMLSTRSEDGAIAARPMSDNRQLDFDGDSYFFTVDETRTVTDIERDPQVGLGHQGKSGVIGAKPFFLSVEGRAELIRDASRSIGRKISTRGSTRASQRPAWY